MTVAVTGVGEAIVEVCRTIGVKYEKDAPMQRYTTMAVGGEASLLVEPETEEQWLLLLKAVKEQAVPWTILGRGSNLLFPDDGFEGVVFRTTKMDKQTVSGKTVTAQAGVSLTKLCRLAQGHGLSGLTFAYGIPGSVGGAVYMNAGAYGGEMADVVDEVVVLDSDQEKVLTLGREALRFSYRHSLLQEHPEWILLRVTLMLSFGDPEQIAEEMKGYLTLRKEKQPLQDPSAGSFFKRPVGAYAGKLIEDCGLKGYRVGDAAVSEKHAGFLVNKGKATTADILRLAERVRETVYRRTGILLEPEVVLAQARVLSDKGGGHRDTDV